MVRNAKDVPGLNILNSNNSEQSAVFSGSAQKSTSKKGNITSSSNSLDNLK